MKMKIGFIGIGVMGEAMAGHLLAAGHELFVYNRTKEKADALVAAGAIWCHSVKEIAEQAEVVFAIIGVPTDVEEVFLGREGLVVHARPGTILVDMTTSKPQLAKEIYGAGVKKGVSVLDIPVSGGDLGARNGTLTLFGGGDRATFEKIRPLLELMGKTITYFGPAGSGQHAKMANQIAISGAVIGMAEALAYASAADLDLEEVIAALSTGAAASWQMSNMAPRVIKGDFAPGFFIKHFIKDMAIAMEEGAAMDLELPALELVLSRYRQAQEQGLENEGTQAIYKLYE